MNRLVLRLYIAGYTPISERAIRNIRGICEHDLEGRYELRIIDLDRNPEAGDRNRVVVTPTLIKRLPPPLRRVIGDLSDRDSVIAELDIVGEARAGAALESGDG